MWDLPAPGFEPVYIGWRILNHCATREVSIANLTDGNFLVRVPVEFTREVLQVTLFLRNLILLEGVHDEESGCIFLFPEFSNP